MKHQIQLISVFLCLAACLRAQDTIRLANPSFEEDPPGCYKTPTGWTKIGNAPMLASLQPFCNNVTLPAKDGSVYASLITREDGTWQGLSTLLYEGDSLMRFGKYSVSMYMAFSKDLVQEEGVKAAKVKYKKPVILRIWGYSNRENKEELLAESKLVENKDWEKYEFTLKPKLASFDQIDLEAYYDPEAPEDYNGVLLIDAISDIVRIHDKAPDQKIKGNTLELDNPSFEDTPRKLKVPGGWEDCGFNGESPPAIQPGLFDVKLLPKEGSTYLGMVVRDNDTWQSISQQLATRLFKDTSYVFSVAVAHSENYASLSKATGKSTSFNVPVKLRVWGGNEYCELAEELGETEPVSNTDWSVINLKMTPKKDSYRFLTLEVYYNALNKFPYNGNMLLDDCKLKIPRK
jgi:hypothetical protein